jgi:hypothetical protein
LTWTLSFTSKSRLELDVAERMGPGLYISLLILFSDITRSNSSAEKGNSIERLERQWDKDQVYQAENVEGQLTTLPDLLQ